MRSQKAKVIFQTGSQQRSEFGGHFRKAVEYVWNGRIGKLKTIRIGVGGPAKPCDLPARAKPEGNGLGHLARAGARAAYNSDLCPKGVHNTSRRGGTTRNTAGGGLADMGAHHFDIAQWAMKMDDSRTGRSDPAGRSEEGKAGFASSTPDGIVMIHNEFEKGKDGKEIHADCVFEGTDGTILVSRGGISSLPGDILKKPIGEKREARLSVE